MENTAMLAHVADAEVPELKLKLVRHVTTEGFQAFIKETFSDDKAAGHFIEDVDEIGALAQTQVEDDGKMVSTVYIPMDNENPVEAIAHEAVHVASSNLRFKMAKIQHLPDGEYAKMFGYDREMEEIIAYTAGVTAMCLTKMLEKINESLENEAGS